MSINTLEVSGHNGSWKKATGIFTLNENYLINLLFGNHIKIISK